MISLFPHQQEALQEHPKLSVNEYGDIDSNETCWIENTRRGFVEGVEVYLSEYENDEIFVAVFDSKFAWGISADEGGKERKRQHQQWNTVDSRP